MRTNKVLNLDLEKNFKISLEAKQLDNKSRFLTFNLYDNAKQFDISDLDVLIYFKRSDGVVIFDRASILNAPQGKVEIELSQKVLEVAGILECEINIVDKKTGAVLTSKIFSIKVENCLRNDKAIEKTDEYNVLGEIIKKDYERDLHESKRIEGEKIRADEELKRIEAEKNRERNELDRIENENSRVSKDSIRDKEESKRIETENTRVNEELKRVKAEKQREINEDERQHSEADRVQNENLRIKNDNARVDKLEKLIHEVNECINSKQNSDFVTHEELEKLSYQLDDKLEKNGDIVVNSIHLDGLNLSNDDDDNLCVNGYEVWNKYNFDPDYKANKDHVHELKVAFNCEIIVKSGVRKRINHGLNKRPIVEVSTTLGNVQPTWQHVDNNNIDIFNYSSGGNDCTFYVRCFCEVE